jgi:HSP20 family protein
MTWNDPFRELAQLQRDMNRLWGSFAGDPDSPRGSGVFPALNISEDDDRVYVRAELPGITKDDIEISTHDDNLVITGERKIAENEDVVYHRREREAGSFKRITSLPARIDPGKVEATLRDGVLTITLAKAAEAKPAKIAVRAE